MDDIVHDSVFSKQRRPLIEGVVNGSYHCIGI